MTLFYLIKSLRLHNNNKNRVINEYARKKKAKKSRRDIEELMF